MSPQDICLEQMLLGAGDDQRLSSKSCEGGQKDGDGGRGRDGKGGKEQQKSSSTRSFKV